MDRGLSRRRFFGLSAGAVAGAGLAAAGCAADPTTSSPTVSTSLGAANLRLAWWGGDARHERTRKVIEQFSRKYPDIKVAGEFGGFDGYFEKLSTQTAGGNAPDAFQILQEYVPDYGARGQLLDLQPYVGKLLDLGDVASASVDAGKINGKLVAVSFGDNSPAIIVNTSMLQGYGLALPKPDWTWDDFATLCGQVSAKSGGKVYGSADLGGTSYLVEIWMRQRGKDMYTAEGKLGFDKQDLVDWFTYWSDLRKAGSLVPPAVMALAKGNLPDEPFIKKVAAIWGNYPNQLVSISGLLKDQTVDLAPVPNAKGQKRPGQYIKAVNWLAVYAKSANPEETVALLDFIVNDVEAGRTLGVDRGVAPSSKVRDAIKAGLTPVEQKVVAYLELVKGNTTPLTVPIPKGGGEIYANLRTLNEEIAFGKIPIADGVDRFFTEAGRALR